MQHYETVKLGILGGGQLGRMLIQNALNYNITSYVLDPDNDAPCSAIAHRFFQGSLTDYDTVYNFGKQADIITIEIEHVNCEALIQLEKEGKKVFPQPHAIRLIQDKGLQKEYFRKHHIPTSDFRIIENASVLPNHTDFLPFFMKLRKDGYDGKGVQKITDTSEFSKAFNKPAVLEKAVNIKEEIAVIAARNEKGEIQTFPAVGMQFHPEQNLVEYLYAPANINETTAKKADDIARKIIEKFELVGVLAVEMFIDHEDHVLVNEVAPRPHNSGHHTIEANIVSQYEQHLRAILNLPLGNTQLQHAAVMINLLGEPPYQGNAQYKGLQEVLHLTGTYVHLYGKKTTKPYRKMGHVTITAPSLDEAKEKANIVKNTLKVIA